MDQYSNDFNYCKEIGDEYMDLLTIALFNEKHICLNSFASKSYQLNYGESYSGIEIKHDSKYIETGNIFFETQALNKKQTDIIDGGIMKKDNAWLYIIGTDNYAYAFSKKLLQAKYLEISRLSSEQKQNYYYKYGIKLTAHTDNESNKTSLGMVIPLSLLKQQGYILFELDLTKYKRSK